MPVEGLKNLGGGNWQTVIEGLNLPPLIELGLIYLANTWGANLPLAPLVPPVLH